MTNPTNSNSVTFFNGEPVGPLDRFNAELKARVRAVCSAAEALEALLTAPPSVSRDPMEDFSFVGDGRPLPPGIVSHELQASDDALVVGSIAPGAPLTPAKQGELDRMASRLCSTAVQLFYGACAPAAVPFVCEWPPERPQKLAAAFRAAADALEMAFKSSGTGVCASS